MENQSEQQKKDEQTTQLETKQKIVSIEQYAKLCCVSAQTIYNRIKKKDVNFEIINTTMGYQLKVINLDTFPPVPAQKRGRKKISLII